MNIIRCANKIMPDFDLRVIHNDGALECYRVNSFTAVFYLKILISERKHIHVGNIVLHKNKHILYDERPLNDYKITPEDVLLMTLQKNQEDVRF